MNFISKAINNFKSSFNKHSKTSTQIKNMSSAATPPTVQTPPALKTSSPNLEERAIDEVKSLWNHNKNTVGVAMTDVESVFVPTVDSVVSNVKNQVSVLNDIVASHTKKKTTNTESINKLNVAHLAKIAAIEAENKEHDTQITAAQALASKLTPVVATPTVTVTATTTPAVSTSVIS